MTNGLITLRDAQKLLAASGKSADVNTLIRWIRKGLGRGSGKVKLRAEMVGQWYTTREWIDDFINRRTSVALIEQPNPALLATESVRENEEAKKILALMRANSCRKSKTASSATNGRASGVGNVSGVISAHDVA